MITEKSIKNKIKILDFQEAKNIIEDYEYCLIYMISEMILNQTVRVSEINWEEVKEAWFFGKQGQLHIYRYNDILSAALLDDADLTDAHTLEKTYRLAGKFKAAGFGQVIVKEYIDFDEDGQSYAAYTRLCCLL